MNEVDLRRVLSGTARMTFCMLKHVFFNLY